MAISNFPAALIPIIQQGFLDRNFEQALRSSLAYRSIADRETFPNGSGETVTRTRAGLLPAAKTPLAASNNTNLDNGMTPQTWGVEQYTLGINQYGAPMDLNTVTTRVGIASQFVQNAYALGEQAGRTLDELCRDALFGIAPLAGSTVNQIGGYMGGNTRVTVTLTGAGKTVAVDDVRGFLLNWINQAANGTGGGVQASVGAGGVTLPATVNGTANVITGYTIDGSNVSTQLGGISGSLTFQNNVAVADGTAGNAVIATNAPKILRPNGRTSTGALVAGDTFTYKMCLDAVAAMNSNRVPMIDGRYNFYIDPTSAGQLMQDPNFQRLNVGNTSAAEAIYGPGRQIVELNMQPMRFITTTEAPQQVMGALTVHRPIICGAGALIEGDFEGQNQADTERPMAITSELDGITMVTRPPLDRLQQIISQSWYWIGGFTTPTDTTTTPVTVPTATSSALKRAIVMEHV